MNSGISLVAYTEVKGKAFVRIPNERGRYFLTDLCVTAVECTYCGALVASYACQAEKETPEYVEKENKVGELLSLLEQEGSIVNQRIQYPVLKLREKLEAFKPESTT